MTARIEVKNTRTSERSGTSSKSGKAYSMVTQAAYITTFDRDGNENEYPEKIELNLDKDQPPYAAGFYYFSPASFAVGNFNAPILQYPRLIPERAYFESLKPRLAQFLQPAKAAA